MSFIVREAQEKDLDAIYDLARQFSLLNLPADKKVIGDKIEVSIDSFAGRKEKQEAEYLFVLEDLEQGRIAGSSQVKAKHGTEENPTYSFKVLKRERFSRDLGIGFIHQVLRLNICTDGPTEVGGLVVDNSYRRRTEKVGRLISLNRFLYIGMNLQNFEQDLHSEMAPPLTEEGRSEFWEALGRRFTGMPYQEADLLSHQNKEFIHSLFPEEDIYLCLLDSKARLVLGRVGTETQGALRMLEKQGFVYKEEVDPFDGGPHLGVKAKDVPIIKNAQRLRVVREIENKKFSGVCLLATNNKNSFVSGASAYASQKDEIALPQKTREILQLEEGDEVYCSVIEK